MRNLPPTTAGGDYSRVDDDRTLNVHSEDGIESLIRDNKRKTCWCTISVILLVLVTIAFITFGILVGKEEQHDDKDESHPISPTKKSYCQPTQNCWPTSAQITAFQAKVSQKLIEPGMGSTPWNASYKMKNSEVQTYPSFVLYVMSTQDVVESIRFVRTHNLQVTILSSGHSYTGRSSANHSFQINFAQWKTINFSSTLDTVTVTTGNTWGEIYSATDKVGRIVVGGSAQTVTPGGYTQGGGHSPFAPLHGLAADNVVEFEVVTADARVLKKVNLNSYSDLFWALRGGGGGTFGVVTHVTFKLHVPPPQWTNVYVGYNASVSAQFGSDILTFYHNFAKGLDARWGGYIIPTQLGLTFSLLFAGNITEAILTMDPFVNFHREWQVTLPGFTQFKTFYDYEKNVHDQVYYRTSLFNVLINESASTSKQYSDAIVEFLSVTATALAGVGFAGCTSTHIGRTVSMVPVDSTAVSYGFRNARYSLSCGVAWLDPTLDAKAESYAHFFGSKLYAFANATYFSETNPQTTDWPDRFWGKSHYERLLGLKNKWDPEQVFYCPQCVGSV